MLSHERVWAAIDLLASKHDMSTSGLARRAGLDPTTFNESKRVAHGGRPRWPSTESIAKILDVTGARLEEFAALIEGTPDNAAPAWAFSALPGLLNADSQPFLGPEGPPDTANIALSQKPEGEFTYTVKDDSYLPVYRPGDIIIADVSVPIRRGDRILLKLKTGGILVSSLEQRMPGFLQVADFGREPEIHLLRHSEIDWLARILWVSQ